MKWKNLVTLKAPEAAQRSNRNNLVFTRSISMRRKYFASIFENLYLKNNSIITFSPSSVFFKIVINNLELKIGYL